jgi:hypothetical protein
LRKTCGKPAERFAESLKPLIFKDFMHFIPHISLMQKCIEKTSFIRGGVGGLGVGSFSAYAEMRKETHQVLDFQRFASFRNSSASFPQAFRNLSATHQLLDFQRFANIKQVLDFQGFYASLRCGRVGQG